MPLPVPMCCGRAGVQRQAGKHRRRNDAGGERERQDQQVAQPPAGSASESMPISHSAAITAPVMISVPRGTPRASSQPPVRLAGTLISTKSAVA